MNTTRLLQSFCVLLLLVGFFGCKDHLNPAIAPGDSRIRIKTITQDGGSNTSKVSAFKYDAQGRLSLIIGYQALDSSTTSVENTVFQYDSQSRLTQAQHSVVRRGSTTETYMFSYNSAGQLSGLLNSPSTYTIGLQYNTANQVSTYTKAIAVGGLVSSGGGSFTFTGSNLTSSSEKFTVRRIGEPSTFPPVYGRSVNTTYTFDDKINPFYGVFVIPAPGVFLPFAGSGVLGPFYTYYGGIDNSLNMSQNNVTSAVAGSTTTFYSYTYNVNNLPIRRITTTGGNVVETLTFEYESY
ncbi:hypothetical protein [Spirosoma foliorum]|uniref:DUF4595 domain-containing protein n=1 Tax=Spirosoma foliorum TaxID=2710596 RepID=A0A7G5H2D5_9BACT|nr:hypothetical protein [Spirosoma foliorum]QMW05277.1 hypothetical protein H3H32_10510 [Spirosoma foliorum]